MSAVTLIVGVYGNAKDLVAVGVGASAIFLLWAALAPRGAAIALLVFTGMSTASNVDFGFRSPWRLVLVPFDLAAAFLAVRSITLAADYLAGQQRREQAARDYEANE